MLNTAGALIREKQRSRTVGDEPGQTGEVLNDADASAGAKAASQAYLDTVRQCLPRLIRIVGATPWTATSPTSANTASARDHEQRSAAALAVALLCELDSRIEGKGYLRECVRAALIRWRMSLTGSGTPGARPLVRSGLRCAAAVGNIIELLNESARFQTPELVDDIRRHCAWLSRLPVAKGRDEAALIHALIGAAALARDPKLLAIGRLRLGGFLDTQSPEGWFPQGDCRLDLPRLPSLFQTLASVYARTKWDTLRKSLHRLVEFLVCVSPPDFVSDAHTGAFESVTDGAYGYELLAPAHGGAAFLARLVRRRCGASDRWSGTICTDLAAARLCATLAVAARYPALELKTGADVGCPVGGGVHFHHGGVSVYDRAGYRAVANAREGGALRVWWRSGKPPLDDGGVVVVSAKSFGYGNRSVKRHQGDNACASAGSLVRSKCNYPRGVRRALQWVCGGALPPSVCRMVARLAVRLRWVRGRVSLRRPPRERFSRVILFRDDTVRIRDRVWCRKSSLCVICQARPPVEQHHEAVPVSRRCPVYYTGGRQTQIDREYRSGTLIHPPSHT